MRTAVLAAAIAFRTPLVVAQNPGRFAVRRVARVVMALLDRRRELIDGDYVTAAK